MTPRPNPTGPAPAHAHLPKSYQFVVEIDGDRFDLWRQECGHFVHVDLFSGRLFGVPPADAPHFELILSDGTLPHAMIAVLATARVGGMPPSFMARYDRRADGLLHCPHCRAKLRTRDGFSAHLDRHGDRGGGIYAWFNELACWTSPSPKSYGW